ncbi:MAG: histidine kinase N-terminal 7TM domain-containing protein [Candidatus Binatia bacterium]|nr:histidine kinase N-terminal 7TM domain-containing protein [Candidatus Binatia bacterium]
MLLTGRKRWVKRRLIAALPVITLTCLWLSTPLVWDQATLTNETPLPAIVVTHGPLFWLHVGNACVLLTVSTGLLIAKYVRTWREHWAEAIALLGVILNRVDPESSLYATDCHDTYYAPGYPETDPTAGA